jgi:hypothetical protein
VGEAILDYWEIFSVVISSRHSPAQAQTQKKKLFFSFSFFLAVIGSLFKNTIWSTQIKTCTTITAAMHDTR